MAKEIERKYLLMEDGIDYSTRLFKDTFISIEHIDKLIKTDGIDIVQGYLHLEDSARIFNRLQKLDLLKEKVDFKPTVLRLRKYGSKYLFTIKGPGKMERDEIEFPITKELFDEWWPETAWKRIGKRRYVHPFGQLKLEIDRFNHKPIIIMEIECHSIDEANSLPEFGKDVTEDSRYANGRMATRA